MKLNCTIVFEQIENEVIGLPLGRGAGESLSMLKVNATAREIIGLLEEDATEDGLVAEMLTRYDVEESKLRADIQAVVGLLAAQGLLEG